MSTTTTTTTEDDVPAPQPQGVAPATAGPLLESQTADTKPPKRDKIKKTPKVKKGKVVDISAGDATTSSAPVGPTTTSTPVEAADAATIAWLSRKIKDLDAKLQQCAQDPVRSKELGQERAVYAGHLALLQREQLRAAAAPPPAQNLGDGKISTEADLLNYIIENRKGRPLEKPAMIFEVYAPMGAPDTVKGFGSELRGQEAAGKTLAEYVDEIFMLKKSRTTISKEKIKQPVYVHGVGCGKTALLCHGLALHRKHCENEDLQEMLRADSNPLAIHISFNSDTVFSHIHETSIELALIRRIMSTCLRLNWAQALQLPLSESLRLMDCLHALMAYHRTVHGMKADQNLFVYLGVDEINKLVSYPSTESKPDIRSLKNLAAAIQGLSINDGFVSTLLAGTHYADMSNSFFGSGIQRLNLPLTRLSDDAIESMLRTDAGVSQEYFDDPTFQKLLRDIGPVMRAIGIAVSKLEYQYTSGSILSADAAMTEYFTSKTQILSKEEIEALLGLVFTGLPVKISVPLTASSIITLDTLQNYGTVLLVRSLGNLHAVFINNLMLNLFCRELGPNNSLVKSANRLRGFIDTNGFDAFEKFVAHFYGMKKALLSKQITTGAIPLTSFYPGALIGKGLLTQELQLTPPSVSLECPDGVWWKEDERYPETLETEDVYNHLKNGGVVLNSKGAAVDIIACENVRDTGSSVWQDGVTLYAVKHTTTGKTQLTYDDIKSDLDKAVKVIRASKNHSKALVTMVHFSNREVAKDQRDVTKWKPEWRRSVVIGRHNIEGVVGPLFGRMLTSKHFYANNGASKAKSYSTFARVVPVPATATMNRRYHGTAIVATMRRLFK